MGYLLMASYDPSSIQIVVPTTGQTITAIPASRLTLILNPVSELAALTVNLSASAQDNDRITVATTKAITLLTLSGNSKTIVGAVSTMALGGFAEYQYIAALGVWMRVG